MDNSHSSSQNDRQSLEKTDGQRVQKLGNKTDKYTDKEVGRRSNIRQADRQTGRQTIFTQQETCKLVSGSDWEREGWGEHSPWARWSRRARSSSTRCRSRRSRRISVASRVPRCLWSRNRALALPWQPRLVSENQQTVVLPRQARRPCRVTTAWLRWPGEEEEEEEKKKQQISVVTTS